MSEELKNKFKNGMVPDEVAFGQLIDEATKETDLSGYAKAEDIPSIDGLLYEEQAAHDYLSKIEAEGGYAKKEELPDVSNFITASDIPPFPNLEGFATKEEIPSLDGLASESHVADNYINKNQQPNFATVGDIPDVEGFIKENELSSRLSNYVEKIEAEAFARKSELPDGEEIITKENLSFYNNGQRNLLRGTNFSNLNSAKHWTAFTADRDTVSFEDDGFLTVSSQESGGNIAIQSDDVLKNYDSSKTLTLSFYAVTKNIANFNYIYFINNSGTNQIIPSGSIDVRSVGHVVIGDTEENVYQVTASMKPNFTGQGKVLLGGRTSTAGEEAWIKFKAPKLEEGEEKTTYSPAWEDSDPSEVIAELDTRVNVKSFGATGDGTTDDTEAIKRAIDHVNFMGSEGVLFIPKGNYRITDTIQITSNLEAKYATFRYHGTGVALRIGDTSSTGITQTRLKFDLPGVICRDRGTDGWDGTSVGVQLVNLNTCTIDIPFIQDFEIGLELWGNGQGCSYNTYNLGALWDNHKQLVFRNTEGGWANQSLFLNGRFHQGLSKGAFEGDPQAGQIVLSSTVYDTGSDTSLTSNNTFINTSVEGHNVAKYRLDISGSYNTFLNLRFENHSSTPPKIMYRNNSFRNKIIGGYHSQMIVEEFEGNALGGEIEDGRAAFVHAKARAGLTLDNAATFKDFKDFDITSHRVDYNSETGEFTPRPGKWEITAQVTFAASTGGNYTIRINRGGSVLASNVSRPDEQLQIPLKTSTIESFDGKQSFRIALRQTSTDENLVINQGQYTSVYAKYLGAD